MNKYKIQVINSCQKFLDGLKEYNTPIHDQLCDTIKEIISNPFKVTVKNLTDLFNFHLLWGGHFVQSILSHRV